MVIHGKAIPKENDCKCARWLAVRLGHTDMSPFHATGLLLYIPHGKYDKTRGFPILSGDIEKR